MSQRKTPKLRRNKGPFVKGRNYTPVTVQFRFCETFFERIRKIFPDRFFSCGKKSMDLHFAQITGQALRR